MNSYSPADIEFMKVALELAKRAKGDTYPNPLVGCVIVKDGIIIGKGWHKKAGEPHAEINALHDANYGVQGATVYVTLEPCCHTGRTPPCTDALIKNKIAKVVIASQDPNPKVNGKGITVLKDAGIEVTFGALEQEAIFLNDVFWINQKQQRPFVLYKCALTLDGKMATADGDSKWISCQESRDLVHKWRGEYQGICVGLNTVIADNPRLTCRSSERINKNPVKIIFDTFAKIPDDSLVFEKDNNNLIIITGESVSENRVKILEEKGANIIKVPLFKGKPKISLALDSLYKLEIFSLMLEGGGSLASSFLEENLIDKIAWFYSPKIIGNKSDKSPFANINVPSIKEAITVNNMDMEKIGIDCLISGYLRSL